MLVGVLRSTLGGSANMPLFSPCGGVENVPFSVAPCAFIYWSRPSWVFWSKQVRIPVHALNLGIRAILGASRVECRKSIKDLLLLPLVPKCRECPVLNQKSARFPG